MPNGAALKEELASFGQIVSDGGTVYVITGPDRINEIMEIAVRCKLAATVGPVTLEEAFLQIVGRSIDADEG